MAFRQCSEYEGGVLSTGGFAACFRSGLDSESNSQKKRRESGRSGVETTEQDSDNLTLR